MVFLDFMFILQIAAKLVFISATKYSRVVIKLLRLLLLSFTLLSTITQ